MLHIKNSQCLINNLKQQLITYYLLIGNEIVLIQENIKIILKYAKKNAFIKRLFIFLEKKSDWKKIFHLLQENDLFKNKIILIISIKKNIDFKNIICNLEKISYLTIANIVIIINYLNWLSYLTNNSFTNLKIQGLLINCNSLNNVELFDWIHLKLKNKNITMEKKNKIMLCHYYENNLTELKQTITILSLLWPNSFITKDKLKEIIINSSEYSVLNWIDAILTNQKKRSLKILHRIIEKNYNPLLLTKILQNNLIILIKMKRNYKTSHVTFLKQNKISKNRYPIFINAYYQYTESQIYKIINIIIHIEISIKKQFDVYIWNKFKNLSFILHYQKLKTLKQHITKSNS